MGKINDLKNQALAKKTCLSKMWKWHNSNLLNKHPLIS